MREYISDLNHGTRFQGLTGAPSVPVPIRAMTAAPFGPAIHAGQQDWPVSTDVPADDLLAWRIERL
jgi:hypothetical protein